MRGQTVKAQSLAPKAPILTEVFGPLCSARVGVFERIVAQETTVGGQGFLASRRQGQLMEHFLGPALAPLGQFVQHVGRFVNENSAADRLPEMTGGRKGGVNHWP